MGLSNSNLLALKVFPPSSLLGRGLQFFEFLKYETKSFRDETILSKGELIDAMLLGTKVKKIPKSKKDSLLKEFHEFAKDLDRALLVKNSSDEISEIKWERIDNFCSLLRIIERSDERKIRWALHYIFNSGSLKIHKEKISELLEEFKIKNLDKILKKIIKSETISGLDAEYDEKIFSINHEKEDKIVSHYLADAIEEPSRRSPGELEKEILELIDEGSYSNQEISQALLIDEGLVSRTLSRLRTQDKIVLSSFGQRGARYFTTNCDNCPFGTTKASCRKEALSYIISSFKEDFDLDLTSNDFDSVETNQAILKMKRIVMMARKEKSTKLERNLGENLAMLLSKVVDRYVEIESPNKKSPDVPEFQLKGTSNLGNLPMLYQLGLKKGAQGGIHLMDEMLHLASKSIKKEDRLKIRKHALNETNKFLKNMGLE